MSNVLLSGTKTGMNFNVVMKKPSETISAPIVTRMLKKILCCSLLTSSCLFAKEEVTIDLSQFLCVPTEHSIRSIGCHPIFIDVPNSEIQAIYDTSDKCLTNCGGFQQICALAKKWEKEFAESEAGKPWENVRFGMRDKRPAKNRNKDQKFYLQFSREYGEWVMRNRGEELASIPGLEKLFYQLLAVEKKCQSIFLQKTMEFAQHYPKINQLLYVYKNELRVPISMRVITYEHEGDFSVSPHFDKAAMTILLNSDDDPSRECLIIAPADGSEFDPMQLKRPIRPIPENKDTSSCALFITGSMLEYIGVPLPPTPHAVLPHDRELRHVLVAFCNVPYLDTSHLNYAITYKKDMPENFEKKFE